MSCSPLAQQLNQRIREHNPHLFQLLSARGKRIFWPEQGIPSQSKQAKGCAFNATIGTAKTDDKKLMRLNCMTELAGGLSQFCENSASKDPAFFLNYAPGSGIDDLRKKWRQMLIEKNQLTDITENDMSLPVVCQALTHGLSLIGYLFVDPGTEIIVPTEIWENYELVFGTNYEANLTFFETFTESGEYNMEGLRDLLQRPTTAARRIVILNFPNNPTGYTLTQDEAIGLTRMMRQAADDPALPPLVVVLDDAYFGLVFREGVYEQSMFAQLRDCSERLLVAKVDGATKEDYAWGLRVGFVTYGIRGASRPVYEALEKKTAGAIRSQISNCSHLSQMLLLRTLCSDEYAAEKAHNRAVLKARHDEVRRILSDGAARFSKTFVPVPFNSGYFMCVRPVDRSLDVEEIRVRMLERGVGLIAIPRSRMIRVAFSSTPTESLQHVFDTLHAVIEALMARPAN